MDKIKKLLEGIGASPELCEGFVKEFNAYKNLLREQSEKEFRARIARAREICLEEVTVYKQGLSRRVEVFLESCISRVEREAKKQSAIEESTAVTELTKIKEMLKMDGSKSEGQAHQALVDESHKLKNRLAKITQEKILESKRANKAQDIASKVLRSNRELQEKYGKLNSGGTTLEGVRKEPAKTKTSRPTMKSSQKPLTEGKVPAQQGDTRIMQIAEEISETI